MEKQQLYLHGNTVDSRGEQNVGKGVGLSAVPRDKQAMRLFPFYVNVKLKTKKSTCCLSVSIRTNIFSNVTAKGGVGYGCRFSFLLLLRSADRHECRDSCGEQRS